jgi:hypothetical protein
MHDVATSGGLPPAIACSGCRNRSPTPRRRAVRLDAPFVFGVEFVGQGGDGGAFADGLRQVRGRSDGVGAFAEESGQMDGRTLSCSSVAPLMDAAAEPPESLTVVVPPEQPLTAAAASRGRPSAYTRSCFLVSTMSPTAIR